MKKEFQLFFRHVRMKKAFIHFHYPCFTFPLADLRSIALSTTFLLLFGSFPSPTQIRSKALSTFPIKLTSAAVTFSLPVCVTKCRSGVSSNPILRSHLFSEKSAALGHFAPFWKVVEYFNGTFWRARWSVFRKDTHFPIFFFFFIGKIQLEQKQPWKVVGKGNDHPTPISARGSRGLMAFLGCV